MNLQLQQLSKSDQTFPKSLRQGTGEFVLIIECQGALKMIVENNWDLETQNKQNQAQGCSKDHKREFPLLLTNTSGEMEITIKGETTKALVQQIMRLLCLFLTFFKYVAFCLGVKLLYQCQAYLINQRPINLFPFNEEMSQGNVYFCQSDPPQFT